MRLPAWIAQPLGWQSESRKVGCSDRWLHYCKLLVLCTIKYNRSKGFKRGCPARAVLCKPVQVWVRVSLNGMQSVPTKLGWQHYELAYHFKPLSMSFPTGTVNNYRSCKPQPKSRGCMESAAASADSSVPWVVFQTTMSSILGAHTHVYT